MPLLDRASAGAARRRSGAASRCGGRRRRRPSGGRPCRSGACRCRSRRRCRSRGPRRCRTAPCCPSTFAEFACSAFRTLPRSGRIACVWRSRPCLAEPPAESPSTMKSSDSAGSVEAQSASLPGRFRRWEIAVLRVTCWAAARRRLAGPRRQDDPADDLLGDGGVLVQPVLEGRADGAVDLRRDLGVVEPVLRLPLELRLEDVDGEERRRAPRGCPPP